MKNVFLLLILAVACGPRLPIADTVLLHATVYTANDDQPVCEAVAIKDGRILAIGTDEIEDYVGDSTEVLDLKGKYVYPGFIDGHAHIMGIGSQILNVDLAGAGSYEEVVALVKARAAQTPKGEWILGSGWHQDKWKQTPEGLLKGFPTHDALSAAVPDNPVWLAHASGHAGLANAQAMTLAGITNTTADPAGGEIIRTVSGVATGLFNETAATLIEKVLPVESHDYRVKKLSLAIEECLRNGLVGMHQAGSGAADIEVMKEFAESNTLKLRLHVMLDGMDSALLQSYFALGPQSGLYDQHLNIRSIKLYADGALGSRGAWLLAPYSDAPGLYGQQVTPMAEIEKVVAQGVAHGFQVCTHAIGDRANREILNIYEAAFKEHGEQDYRFRIEHAQHIDSADIPRFGELGLFLPCRPFTCHLTGRGLSTDWAKHA